MAYKQRIYSENKIKNSLSSKREKSIHKLSDTIITSFELNGNLTPLEKSKVLLRAFRCLKSDLELEVFQADYAFPDEEVLIARLNNTKSNIEELSLEEIESIKTKEFSKEEKEELKRRIYNFLDIYYKGATITNLINKLNVIKVFRPNLLSNKEEFISTTKRRKQ